MKAFRFLLLLVMLTFISCSTWRKVPDKMDAFVGNAEVSASKYTAEDWAKSKEEYQALINEFSEHEDQYTDEEKARVMKDIGRYHALMVVNGLNEAASFVQTIKQILPEYLNGINEVINENKGGVSDMIKGILNPEGLDQAVRGLVESLSGLGEEVNESVEEALEGYEEVMEEWEERKE